MAATLKCQRCGEDFGAVRVDAKWCPNCRVTRAKERQERYEAHKKESCPSCGKPMTRRSTLCKSCENKTRAEKYKGENNPNWRNGRTIDNGYVLRRVLPTGEKGRPYYPEHRLVWEQVYGKLPKGWVVHHLNGIRSDNRIENLLAMPRNSHHHDFLTRPYQERILELERQLNTRQCNIVA